MEAIILAGGLGTRLRSEINGSPKCMAPINGTPFIDLIVVFLKKEGVEHLIFSLGYKSQVVIDHLNDTFPLLKKTYVVETEPLGTGGAIKKAMNEMEGNNVIIVNGDTYFNIDIPDLMAMHINSMADCTIALKEMVSFDRYGTVEMNEENRITRFNEKEYRDKGAINAGVYILNKHSFMQNEFVEKFSFEKGFLEKGTVANKFIGKLYNNYFIDIGIPEDYHRFEKDCTQRAKRIKENTRPGGTFLEFITELLMAFD